MKNASDIRANTDAKPTLQPLLDFLLPPEVVVFVAVYIPYFAGVVKFAAAKIFEGTLPLVRVLPLASRIVAFIGLSTAATPTSPTD
ncbi:MAG: hypothetical protein IJU31_05080 [Synergistaceae bacterium]|nr:hypothetical protein [Synergistaceae bacterium]